MATILAIRGEFKKVAAFGKIEELPTPHGAKSLPKHIKWVMNYRGKRPIQPVDNRNSKR